MSSAPHKGIRGWTGARLLTVLIIGWFVGYALFGTLILILEHANLSSGVKLAALLLPIALLGATSLIGVRWAWNRSEIGRWHVGKLAILWGLLGLAAYVARQVGPDFVPGALTLAGAPLLVLTWSWLTGREVSR